MKTFSFVHKDTGEVKTSLGKTKESAKAKLLNEHEWESKEYPKEDDSHAQEMIDYQLSKY